jgi:protein ImuA
MSGSRAAELARLRARIAAVEAHGGHGRVLPFGDPRIDGRLPGGGLPLGRWHEAAGAGLEAETAVAPAAFVAALAARLAREGSGADAVVWVARREDLHGPGAAALGLDPDRLILVGTRSEAETFAALEDALRTVGVAAAVAEAEALDLTTGRRLQLACEARGATGFVVRRRLFGKPAGRSGGGSRDLSAAETRWRIEAAPSEPEAGEPGLGPPRWRATLERARGGRDGTWILEAQNGADPFRVVAELGDHLLATPDARVRAAG